MTGAPPAPHRRRRRYVPDWPNYAARRRRLSRGTLLLGAMILLLAVVAGELRPTEEVPPPQAPGALALVELESGWFAASSLNGRADATRVAVERVIDGDTVDVLAAQDPLRVRFFGIDTAERGEACFAEASARTAALVGREVVLVPDARLRDRSGRELRYVFGLDGRSIDATLVAEGLARAWRDDGALRDRLVAIEDDARRAKRGCLWE